MQRRTFLEIALSGAVLARATDGVSAPISTPPKWERSYWLHASLGVTTQNGYWGWGYRNTRLPTTAEVRSALEILVDTYGANCLYLIYHREIPLDAAGELYRAWRRLAPSAVEIVPTLLLRMYDAGQSELWAPQDLLRLSQYLRQNINRRRIAVYDVLPNRPPGAGLDILREQFPGGLVRVGLQPGEALGTPYAAGVEDTWSGFCHGQSHADWRSPGFGAETLRKWVEERNRGLLPVSWDLIAVAWDYLATRRGEYPGYDDAERNLPLPTGRNRLALEEILRTARPDRLLGFSADLFIVQVNSLSARRDGEAGSLYEVLKRGHRYRGYFSQPLDEIGDLFHSLGERQTRGK